MGVRSACVTTTGSRSCGFTVSASEPVGGGESEGDVRGRRGPEKDAARESLPSPAEFEGETG